MKIFKNRDNKREWDKLLDEEGGEAVEKEIDKVAPPWVEDAPLRIKQGYINNRKDSKIWIE